MIETIDGVDNVCNQQLCGKMNTIKHKILRILEQWARHFWPELHLVEEQEWLDGR